MRIDIIIPLFNSEKILDKLIFELHNWSLLSTYSPHFIFVDDGSVDNTTSYIKTVLNNFDISYTLISLSENLGQHTATWVGLQNTLAPIAVTIDDDLQHLPIHIDYLVENLIASNSDLIYANYTEKKHNFFRNFGTYFLQQFLFFFTSVDYRKITSFRVLKTNIINPYRNHSIKKIYFIEEILLKSSFNKKYLTINHSESIRSESNYNWVKLSKMAFNIIFYHSTFLLRFITILGVFFSIFFFLIILYFLYQKLFYYAEIGFTAIIVSIFFSTGLILFSMGIIGEYIRRIWNQQQNFNFVNFRKIEERTKFLD